MAKKQSPIKPYLKWAGGKRQLLPEIRKYLPPNIHTLTYYEPFVGAGAVFFDVQPSKAVINDCNTELIMTYHVIRDYIEELITALQAHQKKNTKAYYYEVRAQDRDSVGYSGLGEVEKAARLIFINKTCYNGLYRVNAQGLFNVPYGKYPNPAICEEPVLRAVHQYLSSNAITMTNGDFEDAVKVVKSKAFVYFDPPYHSPDKTNFTGYHAGGFDETEQVRLRDTVMRLTKRSTLCLLSNSDTPFIRNLYQDRCFEIIPVVAKRAINSNADGRGRVNEVLIKNWK
ncbi:MAG: DNA adenine methylase [Treponema sp.]|jgi:DNA adenine methylase|nr:DNA adenine methylase [Treponema sp.]